MLKKRAIANRLQNVLAPTDNEAEDRITVLAHRSFLKMDGTWLLFPAESVLFKKKETWTSEQQSTALCLRDSPSCCGWYNGVRRYLFRASNLILEQRERWVYYWYGKTKNVQCVRSAQQSVKRQNILGPQRWDRSNEPIIMGKCQELRTWMTPKRKENNVSLLVTRAPSVGGGGSGRHGANGLLMNRVHIGYTGEPVGSAHIREVCLLGWREGTRLWNLSVNLVCQFKLQGRTWLKIGRHIINIFIYPGFNLT